MNRNQTEGHTNETRDKSANPDDESGTVLGEINDDAEKDDAKKHGGKARDESEDTDDNARKHGDKKGTVLGEINDDTEEGNE